MTRWRGIWLCVMIVLVLTAAVAPAGAQGEQGDAVLGDGAFTPLVIGDGVLMLLYPTGWALDEQGLANSTLVFVSDGAMVGRPAETPYAPGEASFALTLLPTGDLANYGLPNDSLNKALIGIVASLRASETDRFGASRLSLTLPELVPAAEGRPELAQAYVGLPGEVERHLLLWAVSDQLWALLTVSAAPGELAGLTDQAQVLLRSVQLDGTVADLRAVPAEQGGAS